MYFRSASANIRTIICERDNENRLDVNSNLNWELMLERLNKKNVD